MQVVLGTYLQGAEASAEIIFESITALAPYKSQVLAFRDLCRKSEELRSRLEVKAEIEIDVPGVYLTGAELGVERARKGLEQLPCTKIYKSGLVEATRLCVGNNSVLAIRANGSLWGWGEERGLGIGSDSRETSPFVQVPGLSGVVDVATGHDHNLAVLADGTVWAWGENDDGRLGDGTTRPRWKPTRIGTLKDIVDVSSYGNSSLAVDEQGRLWAWGDRSTVLTSEEWDAGRDDTREPIVVRSITGVARTEIGYRHVVLLKKDGTVWTTGTQTVPWPILGTGIRSEHGLDQTNGVWSQVKGLDGIIDVRTTSHTVIVLREDGTIWGWGSNECGELGNDSDEAYRSSSRPVRVTDLRGVAEIGIGGGRSSCVLARLGDGSVQAWGAWTFADAFAGREVGKFNNQTATQVPIRLPIRGVTAIGIGGSAAAFCCGSK